MLIVSSVRGAVSKCLWLIKQKCKFVLNAKTHIVLINQFLKTKTWPLLWQITISNDPEKNKGAEQGEWENDWFQVPCCWRKGKVSELNRTELDHFSRAVSRHPSTQDFGTKMIEDSICGQKVFRVCLSPMVSQYMNTMWSLVRVKREGGIMEREDRWGSRLLFPLPLWKFLFAVNWRVRFFRCRGRILAPKSTIRWHRS